MDSEYNVSTEENLMTVEKSRSMFLICLISAIAIALLMIPSLLHFKSFGISLPLCVFIAYASYFILMRKRYRFSLLTILQFVYIIVLALSFAIYNNPLILFFNFVLLMILVPVHLSLLSGGNLLKQNGEGAFMTVCLDVFGRPLVNIGKAFKSGSTPETEGKAKIVPQILIGIGIAIPIVAILSLILNAADNDFFKLFEEIKLGDIIGGIIIGIVAFIFLISHLYGQYTKYKLQRDRRITTQSTGLPQFVIYTVLTLVAVVLLIFSGLQISKILSGTVGHYSKASHEMYFPMMVAAVFCYLLQWIGSKYTKKTGSTIYLKIIITIILICIVVLNITSFIAIVNYISARAYTPLRIYVFVTTLAIFLITITYILKTWIHMPAFKISLIVLAVLYIALNFMNVDRFIAEQNIRLSEISGKKADPIILSRLSCDAIPAYEKLLSTYKIDTGVFEPNSDNYDPNLAKVLISEKVEKLKQDCADIRNYNLQQRQAYEVYMRNKPVFDEFDKVEMERHD